jgi:hypothetical protein
MSDYPFTMKAEAENARLRAEIAALVAAVREAAATFDRYARYHVAKTPPDHDKATHNRLEAAALRAALAPFEKSKP